MESGLHSPGSEEIVVLNSVSSPVPKPSLHSSNHHEAIRRRAEEIYIRSGRIPGRDTENWIQAEQEIQREYAALQPGHRPAVVVKVNGVQYVGEYNPSDDYTPGEFAAGVPTPVRFEGDKMFVKRPNGKELETTIVRKVE